MKSVAAFIFGSIINEHGPFASYDEARAIVDKLTFSVLDETNRQSMHGTMFHTPGPPTTPDVNPQNN